MRQMHYKWTMNVILVKQNLAEETGLKQSSIPLLYEYFHYFFWVDFQRVMQVHQWKSCQSLLLHSTAHIAFYAPKPGEWSFCFTRRYREHAPNVKQRLHTWENILINKVEETQQITESIRRLFAKFYTVPLPVLQLLLQVPHRKTRQVVLPKV